MIRSLFLALGVVLGLGACTPPPDAVISTRGTYDPLALPLAGGL